MSRKKKDPVIKDYEKLRDEIVIDKVNKIFRTQPDNYIAALEEIGFEYHEEDDYEEIEERNARPRKSEPEGFSRNLDAMHVSQCIQNHRIYI